jgi:benzoyl-CoA reductase/2-hydroxyglutaryl-CoA dehydratase subunit BcrC/BadD/HgdB
LNPVKIERKDGMLHVEDKLKDLMNIGSEANRTRWAYEWQKQGKKVIGILDPLVPEEVVYAAGMLPLRIQGTWQEDVSLAMIYRLPQSCSFLKHVMQSLIEGEYNFLNGMTGSNRDADFGRLWDAWASLNKTPFVHIIDVPIIESERARRRFATKIRDMMSALAELGNVIIDDAMLRNAIAVYDKSRALIGQVYELRKKEVPPLTGGEFLSLTIAATVMPRDEYNKQLEDLLPYLEKRKAPVSRTRPRILLSSDLLDNPAYIDMIEEAGCIVAMDNMDTGSRYFREEIGSSDDDPAYALAKHYLNNGSARMVDWQKQTEQLTQQVKEYNIDGVLDLPDIYDYPREFRRTFMENKLKEAGILEISFAREYHLANTGQLKTRIEAFLEMLEDRGDG